MAFTSMSPKGCRVHQRGSGLWMVGHCSHMDALLEQGQAECAIRGGTLLEEDPGRHLEGWLLVPSSSLPLLQRKKNFNYGHQAFRLRGRKGTDLDRGGLQLCLLPEHLGCPAQAGWLPFPLLNDVLPAIKAK